MFTMMILTKTQASQNNTQLCACDLTATLHANDAMSGSQPDKIHQQIDPSQYVPDFCRGSGFLLITSFAFLY